MAAARRWTTADDDRLRELHTAGKSLHAIATEMGRGKATVSRKAKDLGLTWDRAQVAAATVAKVRDAAARRADALDRELAILEHAQTRLLRALNGHGWATLTRGEGGAEHVDTLTFVPSRDLRDETSSRNSMAAIIAKLEDTQHGADDAKSLLTSLGRALGVNDSTTV